MLPHGRWPFADHAPVADAFARLVNEQNPLSSLLVSKSGVELGFKNVAHYSLSVFREPPPIKLSDGEITSSPYDRWIHFRTTQQRDLARLILSGRWGYLWWLMYGDELNTTREVVTSFPAGISFIETSTTARHLLRLAIDLDIELPRHLKWQTNAGVEVGRYDLRECHDITNEADWLLADAWGLTRAQYEAAGNLRDRMTFGQK